MKQDWCCALPAGVRVAVQIMPNARKNEVIGLFDDALKIRLQAQPVDGKANDAPIRFFADMLGIPKSLVLLVVCFAINRTQKRVFSRHASLQILAIGQLSLWFAPSLTQKSIAFVCSINCEAHH